ncbi:hypothetical protein PRNP1_001978 [Phytophthora ramorum]
MQIDCRTSAMSCSFRNLTQETQAMDRPALWDEDVESLAEEVWLPFAEDFSERNGEPGSVLALPLVGTSFFGLRHLRNQSVLRRTRMRDIDFDDPMLDDDAINSCIKIELGPTPQQHELLK